MSNAIDPDRPVAEAIAGHVSSVLDRASIHHILWGQLAFVVYGAKFSCNNIDFVVQEADMTRAVNNLLTADFVPVTDNARCSYYRIPAESHREKVFHIDTANINGERTHFDVRLYPMHWALPGNREIGYRAIFDHLAQRDLILATDERLPGAFRHERYPVRMLAPVHYLQSMLARYLTMAWGRMLIRQFGAECIEPLLVEEFTEEGFDATLMHSAYEMLYSAIMTIDDEDELKPVVMQVRAEFWPES
ncbi:uncharacterized protein BO95DRAFT_466297 [Aspergillus brunneoviolaceus CBS 621.78]|uniref:Uncharacterized protein n=1 Tax=Aspergillus brunneoviolaceus CBS 621.78 TaxID=1450534 RepID=A0ACD1G1G5_9EURO|nr:hypothetical protein BO95DRAFT_466297 [Aspergillus brunneoviolaceus CBS 621.78]RAH43106.1 hypothetical protein BO95DRAFT_466297 [Aspergillus brunneoviolaceus CBS 621.78]